MSPMINDPMFGDPMNPEGGNSYGATVTKRGRALIRSEEHTSELQSPS